MPCVFAFLAFCLAAMACPPATSALDRTGITGECAVAFPVGDTTQLLLTELADLALRKGSYDRLQPDLAMTLGIPPKKSWYGVAYESDGSRHVFQMLEQSIFMFGVFDDRNGSAFQFVSDPGGELHLVLKGTSPDPAGGQKVYSWETVPTQEGRAGYEKELAAWAANRSRFSGEPDKR